MAEGMVVACHNLDEWNQQLEKCNQCDKLVSLYVNSKQSKNQKVVVDFTASWCGPCRLVALFLNEMVKSLPNIIFLKVDVDELKSVAEEWAVEAMPTFVFMKEGKILNRVFGVVKDELQVKVAQYSTSVDIAAPTVTSGAD